MANIPVRIWEYDWHKFEGKYRKKYYDLRFPNGVIHKQKWPNAGQFLIPAEERVFDHDRVLTKKDKFEIRISEEAPGGYKQ